MHKILPSLILSMLLPLTTFAQPSQLFLYDADTLLQLKDNQNEQPEPALGLLIKRANAALKNPIRSVTQKQRLPASGNPNDYFSIGPYWWPNPDSEDGLPFIRKDGERNYATLEQIPDSQLLRDFVQDVSNLAVAYHLTGDRRYGETAIKHLQAWFIHPATRMNPNFEHAQAVPGVASGRGFGIIEGRFLIHIPDTVQLLGDALSENDRDRIIQWFSDLNQWMLTSENGKAENDWHNNHGTWFDAQVVAYALFTGDLETARTQLKVTQERRITQHFDADGKQPAEFERTRPWHYANFNLEAYNLLGQFGRQLGVDIWGYSRGNISLHRGYSLIANYLLEPESWPFKELYGMDIKAAHATMYYAQNAYGDKIFSQALEKILSESSDSIVNTDPRLWPIQ
ncbi:alginate lyase family protein [Microbulbifer bruguierae]|uniref:Alginate lyase family protein n=1 Tax=Microbulbifer bruguierae TaxID=3029061 RepID=A0ABY8NA34_9GAMM|nr:alginate lyase family protein [Microbulbifer bruguierae]WGL15766.1 alginate lyase family protein [Microbulbifer bruguierae]